MNFWGEWNMLYICSECWSGADKDYIRIHFPSKQYNPDNWSCSVWNKMRATVICATPKNDSGTNKPQGGSRYIWIKEVATNWRTEEGLKRSTDPVNLNVKVVMIYQHQPKACEECYICRQRFCMFNLIKPDSIIFNNIIINDLDSQTFGICIWKSKHIWKKWKCFPKPLGYECTYVCYI